MTDASVGDPERAIANVLSAYAHAVDDGDIDAVLRYMSEDAVVQYEGGKFTLRGHAEIRKFLAGALIGASTHLISNVLVTHGDNNTDVRASAIVCVTRLAGTVQIRGVTYRARVIPSGQTWLMTSLAHKSTWQFSAPLES